MARQSQPRASHQHRARQPAQGNPSLETGANRLSPAQLTELRPLIERLEKAQARMAPPSIEAGMEATSDAPIHAIQAVPTAPAPATLLAPAGATNFNNRMSAHEAEMRQLHDNVLNLEQRADSTLQLVRNGFEELRQEIPLSIEASVSARIADLEVRLQANAKESWNRSFTAFEQRIEGRVSNRMGSIEKALSEQADTIGSLHARAERTDHSLQRLISKVDQLCDAALAAPSRPVARRAEPAPVMPFVPVVFPSLVMPRTSRPIAVKVGAKAYALSTATASTALLDSPGSGTSAPLRAGTSKGEAPSEAALKPAKSGFLSRIPGVRLFAALLRYTHTGFNLLWAN